MANNSESLCSIVVTKATLSTEEDDGTVPHSNVDDASPANTSIESPVAVDAINVDVNGSTQTAEQEDCVVDDETGADTPSPVSQTYTSFAPPAVDVDRFSEISLGAFDL